MKILCTICARSGSKGVLNKNIKKINNKPLIIHTIDQAIKSKLFDKIVVSTDSDKICKISMKRGIDKCIKRPNELSNDYSPKLLSIKHAFIKSEFIFEQKFDILIDLDVTSPLRNISDIKKALNHFKKNGINNLISVCLSRKNPYYNMYEFKNKKLNRIASLSSQIKRRQDAPIVYENNASIYIWNRKAILKNSKILNKNTIFYEMPYERSIDIDSKFDFKIVKYLIGNK
jgi:CMP-N,N'-diacetyllegionaminic acid synthase